MKLIADRYEEISRLVVNMYNRITIKQFPIDCFDLCDQLNIVHIPYSQLTPEDAILFYDELSKDGFSALIQLSRDKDEWRIHYNDDMPKNRIRFTVMHEIGHVVLDHSQHSDLAEAEANYFARYALAPPPLVHKLEIEDYTMLAERFNLSYQCAYYAMQAYMNWRQYGAPVFLDYELQLLDIFKKVA